MWAPRKGERGHAGKNQTAETDGETSRQGQAGLASSCWMAPPVFQTTQRGSPSPEPRARGPALPLPQGGRYEYDCTVYLKYR